MRGLLFLVGVASLVACGRLRFEPLADGDAAVPLDATASVGPPRLYLLDDPAGTPLQLIHIIDVGADGELTVAASSPYSFSYTPQNLTPNAEGTRLYVVGRDSNVHTLAIDLVTGALTEIDADPIAAFAENVVIHPSGRWLYVPNYSTAANVFGFDIAADGTLSAIAGSPFAHGGLDTTWIEVEPQGRWLYAGSNDDLIYGLAISPTTGALSALPSSPWDSNAGGPWVLLIDGQGRHGYVAPDLTGGIPAFTIDQSTGALSTTPGGPFGSASVTFNAAIDRARGRIALANQGDVTFGVLALDGVTGVATDVPGSPFDSTPFGDAITVAVIPWLGDFLVGTSPGPPLIVQFRVTAGGLVSYRNSDLPGVQSAGRMAIVGNP